MRAPVQAGLAKEPWRLHAEICSPVRCSPTAPSDAGATTARELERRPLSRSELGSPQGVGARGREVHLRKRAPCLCGVERWDRQVLGRNPVRVRVGIHAGRRSESDRRLVGRSGERRRLRAGLERRYPVLGLQGWRCTR